ncbi:tetratricopeptide repeat protein [Pseudarthrobacter sp. 1C304]|uniref:tetratricopeptide repeat protein n=1 Tax=Pseudarthrobacter sp. 1C304 TaxID=3457438 RepID=UPI003FD41793
MAFPSGTSDWPDAGFPGIKINPDSLVAEVVNEEVCAAALAASTDPGDVIFVRLVEGHAAEAAELLAEARYSDPGSLRLRIFEADILRVSNRLDRAVDLFRQLLAETHGTPDEAAIRQHLGRAYFASGNISAAVESFTKALDLRVTGSADAALIYASTVALRRARDVADLAS